MSQAKHSISTRPSPADSLYFKNSVLNEICSRAADRAEDLFAVLDVDVRRSGKRYVGMCPVHGGDCVNALNYYPDGERARGNWDCYTKHCEVEFGKSTIGFVRGVLSHRKYEWDGETERRMVPHRAAVDYLLDFLHLRITDIRHDPDREEERRFFLDVDNLTRRNPELEDAICTREEFRRYLQVPARYFLDRGYRPETLDRYDVGLCTHARKTPYGRVVVPMYDSDHTLVIGFVSRSPHEQCGRCKLHHAADSPCPAGGIARHAKWSCREGFVDSDHLYNYWFAKDHVAASGWIVLVEGPADVWRLEEAGVHNSVALMGSELTDAQQGKLSLIAINHVVILTDMDDAGERAARQIEKKCWFANAHRLRLEGVKDVGEMDVEDVRRHVRPFVDSKMS